MYNARNNIYGENFKLKFCTCAHSMTLGSECKVAHRHFHSGSHSEACGDFLTHWGRVTHICVSNLTTIGWGNGLSPERRRAIIWTNAGILLIGPLGTNISEIIIEIQTFSLKKIRLKMSSAKCCSFRLGLNVLSSKSDWCLNTVTIMRHATSWKLSYSIVHGPNSLLFLKLCCVIFENGIALQQIIVILCNGNACYLVNVTRGRNFLFLWHGKFVMSPRRMVRLM